VASLVTTVPPQQGEGSGWAETRADALVIAARDPSRRLDKRILTGVSLVADEPRGALAVGIAIALT
jgi:hypothetical protein